MDLREMLMRRRGKQNRGKPDPPATVESSSSTPPETEASATSTKIAPSSLGAVALRSTNTSQSEQRQRRAQAIELGTIEYCNITPDGRHGDMDAALSLAAATGKPIFANFVEWSG
jgi:hypothetical protein